MTMYFMLRQRYLPFRVAKDGLRTLLFFLFFFVQTCLLYVELILDNIRILVHSIESNKVDHGPLPGNRMEMAFFYIIYFIVFPFFFVNIFVALIIITFQEQGEKELAEGDLNKNQVCLLVQLFFFQKLNQPTIILFLLLFNFKKSCMDFAINAKPIERYMPTNKTSFKYKIWTLVVSTGFEYFILLLITVNTLILMMKVIAFLFTKCLFMFQRQQKN